MNSSDRGRGYPEKNIKKKEKSNRPLGFTQNTFSGSEMNEMRLVGLRLHERMLDGGERKKRADLESVFLAVPASVMRGERNILQQRRGIAA